MLGNFLTSAKYVDFRKEPTFNRTHVATDALGSQTPILALTLDLPAPCRRIQDSLKFPVTSGLFDRQRFLCEEETMG